MRSTAGVRLAAIVAMAGALAFAGLAVPASADTRSPTAIPVKASPTGADLSPDGRYLYVVSDVANVVQVIDIASRTVVGPTIPLGLKGTSIAVLPSGEMAYVTATEGDAVALVDLAGRRVVGSPIPVGDHPNRLVASPDGSRVYVPCTDGTVWVINTASNTTISPPLVVGGEPFGAAISADGTRLLVSDGSSAGNVMVIDTGTGTPIGSPIPTGGASFSVAMSPDNRLAYVASFADGTVTVVDVEHQQRVGRAIFVGDEPTDIAVTPDGSRIYVTTQLDGSVAVIDAETGTAAGSRIAGGSSPKTIDITSDGRTAFVGDYGSNSVTVIDLDVPPSIQPANLPAARLGAPYSASVVADGVPVPQLTVAGSLPAWLDFDPVSGSLHGMPIVAGSDTVTFVATAQVSGIPMQATRTYVIDVIDPSRPAPIPTSSADQIGPGIDGGRGSGRLANTGTGGMAAVGGVAAMLVMSVGAALMDAGRRRRDRRA